MRPSWVEIDLDAVAANVSAICNEVAPALLCAVVKADGYGHGDVPVAEAAVGAGAEWLGVALVEEGIRLREAGIEAPILLLSEPPLGDIEDLIGWRLIPTVYTAGTAEALASAVSTSLPVHIKLNTGMHRVGADPADAQDLARWVQADGRMELQGLWTHFAVAEEDPEYSKQQWTLLRSVRDRLAKDGIDIPIVHAANTAAALSFPDARFDMVRVGLGIYGLRPARHVARDLVLKPAMRVLSHVSMVRHLPAGERPSYGRRRPLPEPALVATVPIGYADGVSRRLSQVGGEVLIRGHRYPYAGTVTMDQVVIDTGDDHVEAGDEVVLLGRQGNEEITAEEWAELLDTINYEVVCGFGPRLPRRYLGPDDDG